MKFDSINFYKILTFSTFINSKTNFIFMNITSCERDDDENFNLIIMMYFNSRNCHENVQLKLS